MFKKIRILFTRKRLMFSKKSQYLFNQMVEPYSKREVKKDLKRIDKIIEV